MMPRWTIPSTPLNCEAVTPLASATCGKNGACRSELELKKP